MASSIQLIGNEIRVNEGEIRQRFLEQGKTLNEADQFIVETVYDSLRDYLTANVDIETVEAVYQSGRVKWKREDLLGRLS